jgi:hypothetical protein
MTKFRNLLTVPLLALALSGPLAAQTLPEPGEPEILIISGVLTQTNGAGVARFDLDMIDALPQRLTETLTPWFEGPQQFSGPLLSDLMAAVGATGSQLRIVAINDYATTLPFADIENYPVILASRHNGETMSVRSKGPLFVIYPFDEFPELRNEVYFARSAWQVATIEIIP